MQLFTNNGVTTLASAVLAGDTTIEVVDASRLPAGGFKLTLETLDRSVNEIVLVTGVAGNVLTVTRAQEGTVASGFAAGSKAEVRVTAGFLNDLQGQVEGLVDDTAVATDKTYSSDKVMQLHAAQQEAIAHLSGASATFSSNVSQLVPEEPAAKVDIVWTNGQASSNASVLELGTNEVLFMADGNYSFLTTITLYRLNDGSNTTVTFELYDADTGTVLKSVSQAVDMIAGTKETLPLNVLVPITGASEANPVRMKVRMGMTAANGTLELFSFSSVLTVQAAVGAASSVYNKVAYVATAGQTTFSTSYTVGMLEVYLNGLKLGSDQFTATDGATVVLGTALDAGDKVEFIKFTGAGVVQGTYNKHRFVATEGQTTFNVSYTVGYVDVYHNGLKLGATDYTATNGTSVVLGTGAVLGDEVEIVAYGMFNVADVYSKGEVDTIVANIDALPSQTGNAGKVLVTDGTTASWAYPAAYTLEWSQTTFYITQQVTAVITNYDSYTSYTVTALLGTVNRVGDTITYTAPSVAGNEVVSVNGTPVASFEVLGAGIMAPTINSPLSGSTDNAEVVTFDLSDFVVVPNGYDTHVSTTVEVYTDAAMTNLSATVTKTTGDLTLVEVGSHVVSTTYYARARYNGSTLVGEWSATRSYTTKATFTQAYGVEWNPTTDTYTRTGLAAGTANSTSYAGAIQTQMKRCVLNANGTVAYYLHPTNSTLKADGSAAVIDGSAGNVMVEIPKFYYKYENVGGVHKWSVSPIAEAGFVVHPAFIRGGVEKNYRYYPAYEGWYNGSKLVSGSGKVPTVNQTRATFRSYAAANGAGWSQIDWNILIAVQLLFLTEYATFDTQAMLGNGNDTGGDYTMTTGGSNSIGNGSSPSTNDDTWMSYRGIENWYASMWKFIDGVNVQERLYYVNSNPATFADDVFTGDYVSTGITSATSNGYVSNLVASSKGFVASAVAGSSATKVPDYFYQTTGNRIVLFGGVAGSGLDAGGFCLLAYYAASDTASTVGSGVSY